MSLYCQLLFLLYLDSFLRVGDTNQHVQTFTVRADLYPPGPDDSRDSIDTPGHPKDNAGLGKIHGVQPNPKKSKCGIQMRAGCRCSKHEGSFSIDCRKAHLCNIPQFDFGPVLVRSLNLEYNNLTEITIGDFFGLKVEILYLGYNCLKDLEFLAFWGLEYHLESLDLSYNIFSKTPANALRLLRHVKTLKLSGNRISILRNNDFSSLHKLQMLFLDSNPITFIESAAFHSCSPFLLSLNKIDLVGGLTSIPTGDFGQLQRLHLADNGLDWIPDGWFQNLTSLQILNLEHNAIGELDPEAFNGAERSLRKLSLKKNKLRRIPQETLTRLGNLEALDLSMNKIRKIRGFSFNFSQQLQDLDLRSNGIKDLHKNSLLGLDNVRKIDLRFNDLLVIDERSFYWEEPEGRQVYLSDNPWLCNCLLKWLKREHRKRTPISKIFADVRLMRCARPSDLEGVVIVRVPLVQFTCDHEYYYYEYDTD